jgi:hypothetical protein
LGSLEIEVESTGWDGRKAPPRRLADWAAAAFLTENPLLTSQARTVGFKVLAPPAAADFNLGVTLVNHRRPAAEPR